MEIGRYKVLLDLAETKNLTRTAENLGYTQPGVSHIMKSMEKEWGFPLVVREKYGVTLTPAAQQLLPRLRELCIANENLEQTIYSIKGLEYGRITIGCYSSIAIHLLPELLHAFKTLHPNLEIDIREGGADNILEWMHEGMLDLAFLSRPYTKSMEFISFGKDPLMAVLPKDYPWKRSEFFAMENFMNQSFIISAAGNDIDVHNALEKSGITLDFHYSVLDDRTIMSMVEKKVGISILSELITTGFEDRLQLVPLKPFYYRELGVGMRSSEKLSPAARIFLEYFLSNIQQIWKKVMKI